MRAESNPHIPPAASISSALAAALAVLFAFALACGFSSPAPAATPAPAQPSTQLPIEPPNPASLIEPLNPITAPLTSPLTAPIAGPLAAPIATPLASLQQAIPPPQSLSLLPSIADLVAQVEPAVASISVESVNRGIFYDFTDEGAGSGIIVRSDGYVVTNYHVIQDVVGIRVHLPDGETYDAEIVGGDIITDIAILKIEPEYSLPVIEWGDSDDTRVGDWVVAVGNALALKGGPTVTLGIISAQGRTVKTEREPLYGMIQTDAAINDGNSGGPLVNMDGQVIGISTAILRQAQGIGFAISSETARPIIDSLIEHGRVVRPLFGMTGEDVTSAIANRLSLSVDEGVILTQVSRNGPAFEAGLEVGDVIVSMDGIPTDDMGGFLTLLWSYDIGDTVQIDYIREDKRFETLVELAERQ